MGQQQLLLLVLSTVIVGLATVAGIQAFSEGQEQATQDALVQESLTLATDIKAAANRPAQLGGPSDVTVKSQLLEAAGIDTETVDGESKVVPVPGAGNAAYCDITDLSRNNGSDMDATIECSSGDQTVTTSISGGEIEDPDVSSA